MIIIDIETAGQAELPDPPEAFLHKGIAASFKPETRDKYIKQNIEDWKTRAALDWRLGQIVAVGCISPGTDPIAIVAGKSSPSTEADLLKAFWQWTTGMEIVGFNIRTFDLPYLIARSVVNGVHMPQTKKVSLAKYHMNFGVIDLADALRFWDAFGMTGWTLGFYAEVFGLEHRPAGDSAAIPEAWRQGEYDLVQEHLELDLLTTRDLYLKFKPLIDALK